MPHIFDLQYLFHPTSSAITSESDIDVSRSTSFLLTCLGTDTYFTETPSEEYPDGESLSFTAQAFAQLEKEQKEDLANKPPRSALSYKTPSVAVLNGPTTLGSEVGDRIAEGVFLCLQALMQGKTNVSFHGHSRGAVESLMIAHELQRIKEALQQSPDKTLYQILSASPCEKTSKAFQSLFKEINEPVLQRQTLLPLLDAMTIHMSLLDPVPGGSFNGLAFLRWEDPRFYQPLPDLVVDAEIMYVAHERTCCFIPITIPPKDRDDKRLKETPLPGNHGTLSGIPTNHKKELSKLGNDPALQARNVAVIKIMNRLLETHKELLDNHTPVTTKNPSLDSLVNDFIHNASTSAERRNFLAAFYTFLYSYEQENGFDFYTEDGYSVLGRESIDQGRFYHSGILFLTNLLKNAARLPGERIVHYRGHNYTAFSTAFPRPPQAVNFEHMLLRAQSKLDINPPQNGADAFSEIKRLLRHLHEELSRPDEGPEKHLQPLLQHAIATGKDENSNEFFLILTTFINFFIPYYLNTSFTSEEHRTQIAEIKALLTQFNQPGALFESCYQFLLQQIKLGFELQVKTQQDNLDNMLANVEFVTDFKDKYKDVLLKIYSDLSSIRLAENDDASEHSKAHLMGYIFELIGNNFSTILEAQHCLLENQSSDSYSYLMNCTQFGTLMNGADIKKMLEQLGHTYDSINVVQSSLPELLSGTEFKFKPSQLESIKINCIQQAARLYAIGADFEIDNCSEQFINSMKNQAKVFGRDPEKAALHHQLATAEAHHRSLSDELVTLQQQNRHLQTKIDTLSQQVNQLTEQHQEDSANLATYTTHMQDLTNLIQENTVSIMKKDQLLDKQGSEINALKQQLAQGEAQRAETLRQNQDLVAENQHQKAIEDTLRTELASLQQQLQTHTSSEQQLRERLQLQTESSQQLAQQLQSQTQSMQQLQRTLTDFCQDPNEIHAFLKVDKLIRLTKAYQQHLQRESSSEVVREKLRLTEAYLATLQKVERPSVTLQTFTTQLHAQESTILKQHRDWKQYIGTALAIISIIPGIVLFAMKGFMMFKTKGEEYTRDCERIALHNGN